MPGTPQVIVGAAIVRAGHLLAARRSAPAALAGGWEFPGGKVEPGESEEQALVRECEEELGVLVRRGPRLGGDVTTSTGAVLRVWVASLDDPDGPVPRPLQDHDALAWLPADQLASVPWLPADWPLVHALAEHLLPAEPLPGGRVGGAVRIGDTVRRPTGSWTPAVHDLLAHLRACEVPAVLEPLGFDGHGREVLRYVPGRTAGDADPVPPPFRSPALAGDVGRWLRRFHEASATFPPEPRVWRRGLLARSSASVVCHNDVNAQNLVLDEDGHLRCVLDWDMAAPGNPLDDVAFAAWQLVLRHGLSLEEEADGLSALADAYGTDPRTVLDRVAPRLRGAVRFMRRGAAAGDEGLQRLLSSGVPESTEEGVVGLLRRRDGLRRLLPPSLSPEDLGRPADDPAPG